MNVALVEETGEGLASVVVSGVMIVGLTNPNRQQHGSHCLQSDLCYKTPCYMCVVQCPDRPCQQ